MKKLFFLFCLIPFSKENGYSQAKRGLVWVSGYSGNTINFTNATIKTKLGIYGNKFFHTGNSNICDSDGNVILASDGFSIYDSLGNYLDNGDTLVPLDYFINQSGTNIGSQTSIFLPMDSDKYYFVTPTFSNIRFADCQANNNCHFDLLLYNVINMKANGGAGKVVQRMIPLMQNAQLRKTQMMACRHSNGKDWWLLKQEGDSANVHKFLFTQDSVYDKGVQVINEPVWGQWDIRGQSAFSNDGNLYATTSHGSSTGLILIAAFDRCYGELYNSYTIQMPWGSQHIPTDTTLMERLSVGLAFSLNNKFLYVISMSNVYQYDLHDSTWFHVAGIDTSALQFQDYETAYLGPDKKVYIGNFGGGSKQMSVIDSPDVKGAGCNFCPRCLRLDSLGSFGIVGTPPCMPNYGLGEQECWPLAVDQYANEAISQLNIYPNPVSTDLTLEYFAKNHDLLSYEIYNTIGQSMMKGKLQPNRKTVVNVSDLPNGVYFLKCASICKKIIKD
jgi:hypothetical protein